MAVPKKMTPAQKRMDAKLDKMEPKGEDSKKPAAAKKATGKKPNPFTSKKK